MQLAVISDTHNNLQTLHKAITIIKSHRISHVIHCGDLTDPETIAPVLDDFTISFVFGNGDCATGAIREYLLKADSRNTAENETHLLIDGINLCVLHGHRAGRLTALSNSNSFDIIFYGHSHRRNDFFYKKTRMINPGALGGAYYEEHSFCIFYTNTHKCDFYYVD